MSNPPENPDFTAALDSDTGECPNQEGEGAAGSQPSITSLPVSNILDDLGLNMELDDPIDDIMRADEKRKVSDQYRELDPEDAATRETSAGATIIEKALGLMPAARVGVRRLEQVKAFSLKGGDTKKAKADEWQALCTPMIEERLRKNPKSYNTTIATHVKKAFENKGTPLPIGDDTLRSYVGEVKKRLFPE